MKTKIQIKFDFREHPVCGIVRSLNIPMPKVVRGNCHARGLTVIFAIGLLLDYLNKREFKYSYSMCELRKEINMLNPSSEKPLSNIMLSELENDMVFYYKNNRHE